MQRARRKKKKKFLVPRAGIEPALSGPQPDVLPLYYHGGYELAEFDSRLFKILDEFFFESDRFY